MKTKIHKIIDGTFFAENPQTHCGIDWQTTATALEWSNVTCEECLKCKNDKIWYEK